MVRITYFQDLSCECSGKRNTVWLVGLVLSPAPFPFFLSSQPETWSFPTSTSSPQGQAAGGRSAFQGKVPGLGHQHLWPWPSCEPPNKLVTVFLHFMWCTWRRFTNSICRAMLPLKHCFYNVLFSPACFFSPFLQYLESIKLIAVNWVQAFEVQTFGILLGFNGGNKCAIERY